MRRADVMRLQVALAAVGDHRFCLYETQLSIPNARLGRLAKRSEALEHLEQLLLATEAHLCESRFQMFLDGVKGDAPDFGIAPQALRTQYRVHGCNLCLAHAVATAECGHRLYIGIARVADRDDRDRQMNAAFELPLRVRRKWRVGAYEMHCTTCNVANHEGRRGCRSPCR